MKEGDEVAAAIHAEQGYLVLGSHDKYQIGQALPHLRGANNVSIVPIVIAHTDEADYLRQLARLRELCPTIRTDTDGLKPFYYRVTAAD